MAVYLPAHLKRQLERTARTTGRSEADVSGRWTVDCRPAAATPARWAVRWQRSVPLGARRWSAGRFRRRL